MTYREWINNLNKNILKWNYAIPLGLVAYGLSNLLGTDTIIGRGIGVFNLLIIIGMITGLIDLIKYIIKKTK
ncbi:MAG: hypothetical protein WC938_00405 [Candidatus Paceibacterota bacterium]|jgi:hypothetical protein